MIKSALVGFAAAIVAVMLAIVVVPMTMMAWIDTRTRTNGEKRGKA